MGYIDVQDISYSSSSRGCARHEGGMPTEIEEGEVGGFANPTYTALSSGVVGPVHTIKSSSTAMQNVGPLKARQHGRHKAWHLRDAPSDWRQRLWS